MKLLEALAGSNFKIYTNYECNYELILQILSYYNVIAEILVKKKKIIKKKRLITIVNTQRSNRQYGMAVGLTYLLIVFVLSPNILPLVIKEGDNFFIKQGIKTYHNWHKYLFGFLTLVAFIIMDVGLVTIYDKTL